MRSVTASGTPPLKQPTPQKVNEVDDSSLSRPPSPDLFDSDSFESGESRSLTNSEKAFIFAEFGVLPAVEFCSDSDDEESIDENGVTTQMLKITSQRDASGYTVDATRMSLHIAVLSTHPGSSSKTSFATASYPHLNRAVEELRNEGHEVELRSGGNGVTEVHILRNVDS